MIDEIPEREPLRCKDANRITLSHLAVILSFIFITLLVMLFCSRGFDYLASKIWPVESNTAKIVVASKTGSTRIDLPKSTGQPLPASPALTPLQSQSNSNQTHQAPQTQSPALSQTQTTTTNNSQSKPSIEPLSPLPEKAEPTQVATPSSVSLENSQPKTEVTDTKELTVGTETVNTENITSTIPASVNPPRKSSKSSAKACSTKVLDKNLSAFEKSILKAQPNHYTIQILAMHNKKKLTPFVERTHIKDKVKCCRGEFKGKPWYMLIYGEYTTREEAQQAIAELPAEIQKEKPWVRKIASVQEAINARK